MNSTAAMTLRLALGASIFGFTVSAASAALTFTADKLANGTSYILVSGDFDYNQDISGFTRLVKQADPVFVAFSSPGGNPSRLWNWAD